MQKKKKLSGDGFSGAVDGRIQDDGELDIVKGTAGRRAFCCYLYWREYGWLITR